MKELESDVDVARKLYEIWHGRDVAHWLFDHLEDADQQRWLALARYVKQEKEEACVLVIHETCKVIAVRIGKPELIPTLDRYASETLENLKLARKEGGE
jgi:hypothetical protein